MLKKEEIVVSSFGFADALQLNEGAFCFYIHLWALWKIVSMHIERL